MCSVIGSLIISLGFYSVMWGKAQEDKGDKLPVADMTDTSSESVPLLRESVNSRNEERAPGAGA